VRILGLADIHGAAPAVSRILAAAGEFDVIAVAGDLTRFFTPAHLEPVLQRLLSAGKPVLAIAGNCDGPGVDEDLLAAGLSISGCGRILDGVGFCGVPASPPHRGQTWEASEDDLARWLGSGYADVAGARARVLVTHTPPDGLTLAETGEPVPGSRALAAVLAPAEERRYAFDAVICGHIHEARGVLRAAPAPLVVNCGCAADGSYALVELGSGQAVAEVRWA
jgi:hypothetical protein